MKRPGSTAAGLTLIELMISLAVASVTILAALRLYAHSGAVIRAAQSEQILEETVQLAVSAIRHDIELAGFLPYSEYGAAIAANDLHATAIPVRNDCGDQWALQLAEPVRGSNNVYDLECRAYAGAAVTGADTLTLRYVEPARTEALESGRVYLAATIDGTAQLFVAPAATQSDADDLASFHALRARAWYVSPTSAADTPDSAVPSLRVKNLTLRNGQLTIVDQEVQPGIEDLQIEFLTDDDQFVSPSDLGPNDVVRAVRIWLLARSLYTEAAVNDTVPQYADRAANVFGDGFKRKLVSATIAITNDRPL